MANSYILSTKNLSKSFGGLKVIEDITLDVPLGERVGLIGPNGAGKTTFFNLIAGDLPPSGGTISYMGNQINNVPNYKRTQNGIVRTFQKNNLMFGLTVKENLLLVLQRMRKKHTQWWKFSNKKNYPSLYDEGDALLRKWNLLEYQDKTVSELSYGVQRQIEIVMAVAAEPKLLLLDEPTAGMSQVETEQVIELINRLPKEITMIMIEHDMDVLFGNMDRIIVLHSGKLIADGTPEKVRENEKVKEIYIGGEETAYA